MLQNSWPFVVLWCALAINAINALTPHFSGHKNVVKWLLFAAEMLSVVVSSNAPGSLKAPLVSVPPDVVVK